MTNTTDSSSTVIWGKEIEAEDFIKIPRAFARLARYEPRVGMEIQPRHLLLIMALASRRFRDQPLRAKWNDLAADLGAKSNTVRRWAYELRRMGLLKIQTAVQSGDGFDRRNRFDIGPFVALLSRAFEMRCDERLARSQVR